MSDQKIDPWMEAAGNDICEDESGYLTPESVGAIIARHAQPVLEELTNAREARDLLIKQVAAQADEIASLNAMLEVMSEQNDLYHAEIARLKRTIEVALSEVGYGEHSTAVVNRMRAAIEMEDTTDE